MIVTVTPNPALDHTYRIDRLEVGEPNRVNAPAVRAGGKGLNVTRVLRQQGQPSHAVTTAGGASGVLLAADIDASGLPITLMPVGTPTRSSIAIVDLMGDATTVLNEVGSPLDEAELAALVGAVGRELASASCLVVSGSLPPATAEGFAADLVDTARAAGVPTIVDAMGDALLLAASAGAAVLKPNRRELAATTKTDDPLAGARLLTGRGAGLVVVSLGTEGMLAVPREGDALHAALPLSFSGNPTGAGDAAVAALAVGLLETASTTVASGVWSREELEPMLRRAVVWSAASVLAPLAGELAPGHDALGDRVGFEVWR